MSTSNNKIIALIYINIYLYFYSTGFAFGMAWNLSKDYDLYLYIFSILSLSYIVYIIKINQSLHPSIFIKIILFTSFLIGYFAIEQLLIALTIYNIGDSGGIIRNNFIGDTFYQFKWYEVLYWNFIFSLHYPIYIFIFIKPFVNHLDKAIQKIKDSK